MVGGAESTFLKALVRCHVKRNTHWPEGSQAPSPSLGLLVIDNVTSGKYYHHLKCHTCFMCQVGSSDVAEGSGCHGKRLKGSSAIVQAQEGDEEYFCKSS